jgi:adenosylcobyric acid synthase
MAERCNDGDVMAALMLQGCGSDVGKSTLVAGLCRLFANAGLTVRPFKPQNMSNNAAVTADGGEIGRAQALQAIACRCPPSVHMNPILLKPQSDIGAQIVIRGRVADTLSAKAFQVAKRDFLAIAVESYHLLASECDVVVVEGAGSPAETNLRANDIANMGFAHAANVPVILIGDIDRGHVIASLAGAHRVLDEADRARIGGFIINKFRGDPNLFDAGRRDIEHWTHWPDLGMVPWLSQAAHLPPEDAVVLERGMPSAGTRRVKIAVPMLPRIANFDDFDPLRYEPQVDLQFIPPGQIIPNDSDLIILPGTKSTIADLAFVRAQGWDIDILSHARRGGQVMGICGGYQMLGRVVSDPQGVEGPAGEVAGLGLLNVSTRLEQEKILRPVSGHIAHSAASFNGYEIHVGRTDGPDTACPFLIYQDGSPQGAISPNGRIIGVYVHGLFHDGAARQEILSGLGATSHRHDHHDQVDRALDQIAASLHQYLNMPAICRLAGLHPELLS